MSGAAEGRMAWIVWFILLLQAPPLLMAQQQAPAGCDCNGNIPLVTRPVCSIDGDWIQNACIAFCGNVTLTNDTSVCGGAPDLPFNGGIGPSGAEGTPANITADVINAYSDQGLCYKGRIALVKDAAVEVPEPENYTIPTASDDSGVVKMAVLVGLPSGDLYGGSIDVPAPTAKEAAWAAQESGALDTTDAAGTTLPAGGSGQGNNQSTDGLLQGGSQDGGAPDLSGNASNLSADSQQFKNTWVTDPVVAQLFWGGSANGGSGSAGGGSGSNGPDGGGSGPSGKRTSSSSSSSSLGNRKLRASRARHLLDIVGTDDRKVCPSMTMPYRAIGQIEVVDSTGLFICTGTLIAPDKVLTAGHCVWNVKRGAFYFNLNFAPGRYRQGNSFVSPYGSIQWKSVTVFDAFKKNPGTWDVAVVTLQKPVGKVAGTLAINAGCLRSQKLLLAGYPQDKPRGTCTSSSCTVPVAPCGAQLAAHSCDTTPGMSGAPLLDSGGRIRMIHIAGSSSRPVNQGTLMSDFLVKAIKKW